MAASSTASASQSVRLAKRALRKAMGARLAAVARDDVLAQSASITRTLLSSRVYREARTISIYLNTPSGEVDTHQLCLDALRSRKTLYVPSFALAGPSSPTNEEPKASSSSQPSPSKQFAAEMSMLRVEDEDDYLSLPTNSYGIREPSPDDVLPPPPPTNSQDARSSDPSSSSSSQQATGPSPRSRRRVEALAPYNHGGTGLDLVLCPGLAFDTYGGRLGHGKGYYDRYLLRAKEWALRERARRARAHVQAQEKEGGKEGGSGKEVEEVRMPIVLALALRQQVLGLPSLSPKDNTEKAENEAGVLDDKVPMDDRDVQLDGILTPDALILPPVPARLEERAPNDAKYDPVPGDARVLALPTLGRGGVAKYGVDVAGDGLGSDWRAWGLHLGGEAPPALRVIQAGQELSLSS